MTIKTTTFDPANYLNTLERREIFLTEALSGGDPAEIRAALGIISRAANLSRLAQKVGVSRQGLIKALGPKGNPSFTLIANLIGELGLTIAVGTKPKRTAKPRAKRKSQAAAKLAA